MQLPEPGDVFERRYEILQVLGEGGFARVFRARDTDVGRTVGLKVISPSDGEYSETSSKRFEREAKVLASLQDPHNITLYDYGTSADGLMFMVFEFVDGVDLKLLLRREGALAPSVVIHVMLQLCAALREAHSIGLLHRDLKPANVLVFGYGDDRYRVKLIDFGIAKPTDPDRSHITQAGAIVGTARYMAPEQALAQAVTERTDIYSLGLVAHEMLTGRPAVQGKDRKTLIRAHVLGDRVALPEGAAPSALARIVDRMVRREPRDRYGTLDEVANDLARVRRDLARGPSPVRAENAGSDKSDESGESTGGAASPGAASFESPRQTRRLQLSRWTMSVLAATTFVIVFLIVAALLPTSSRETPPRASVVATPVVVRVPPKTVTKVEDAGVLDVRPPAERGPPTVENGSSGCGKPVLTQSPQLLQLEFHVPDDYDVRHPHPVVLLLNQRWESAKDLLSRSGFTELADRERFIVVAPEDQLRGWKSGEAGDVADLRDVVELTKRNLCVDESRVFVVANGTSGRTANALTCEPWVAAVAVNSFGVQDSRKPCGEIEKPVIWIAPTKSVRIPIGGGARCDNNSPTRSLAEVDEGWRKRNRCTGPATVRRLEGGDCRVWECGTPYSSCVVDGGYGWPKLRYDLQNGAQGCADEPPPGVFPTAQVMWTFFAAL